MKKRLRFIEGAATAEGEIMIMIVRRTKVPMEK
jgi:hypothetical protein